MRKDLTNNFNLTDSQNTGLDNNLNLISESDNNVIEFKNVSFSYAGVEIIKNFSVVFQQNKIYKITAPSGKGKTTLFRLITGIQDKYSGEILYNNIGIKNLLNLSFKEDIADLNYMQDILQNTYTQNPSYSFKTEDVIKNNKEFFYYHNFYDYIVYLPQENIVFNSDIQSNITLFDDSIKQGDVENILEELKLLEELRKLPDFLNEKINVKDRKLSGGQLRRMCIARSFLLKGERKIILLDEPFTGLDKKNIQNIFNIIRKQFKNSIVIINSHDSDSDGLYDYIIEIK